MIAAFVFSLFVLLPIAWSASFFVLRWRTAADCYLSKAMLAAYVVLAAMMGPWWSWGYPLLACVLVPCAAALVHRCNLAPDTPGTPGARLRRALMRIVNSMALLVVTAQVVEAARGWVTPPRAYELAWPLEPGTYAVGQGGSSELLNHHYSHDQQRFAVDLVRAPLSSVRVRPRARLDQYPSFGTAIRSPCSGTVAIARANLPDQLPPRRDPENAAGNHVAIDCDAGPRVVLAHLAQESLDVRAGDRVDVRQRIGALGNSGNTSEPHLHVHAIDARTRAPRPLTFDGHYPVRNQLAFAK